MEGSPRRVGDDRVRPLDAKGVKQVAFIGVINPQNPRVETAEEVCNDLLTAAKYIPKDQLGATDDCGFSPFSIDVKPKHGSPDVARDIAFQKITNRLRGSLVSRQPHRDEPAPLSAASIAQTGWSGRVRDCIPGRVPAGDRHGAGAPAQ